MNGRIAAAAHRYSAVLNGAVERLVAVGIWLLVADVSVAVASRYLLSTPLSWAEEVGRYLLIWVALLAISIGVARRDHPSLDLLVHRLPRPARIVVTILETLVASVLLLALLWFGLVFVQRGASQSALSLGISMQIPHSAIPVASLLALIQAWLVAVHKLAAPDNADAVP